MRILIVFSIPDKELLCYRKALDFVLCWPLIGTDKFMRSRLYLVKDALELSKSLNKHTGFEQGWSVLPPKPYYLSEFSVSSSTFVY